MLGGKMEVRMLTFTLIYVSETLFTFKGVSTTDMNKQKFNHRKDLTRFT